MSRQVKTPPLSANPARVEPEAGGPTGQAPPTSRRRPAWRRRLADAERGITQGFRGDSAFFVHFFAGTVVVAAAFVLGISLLQWTVLILALTLVLSAELFHQALQAVWKHAGHHFAEPAVNALRIATAAVCVAIAGALLTIGLIFGQRLWELLGSG